MVIATAGACRSTVVLGIFLSRHEEAGSGCAPLQKNNLPFLYHVRISLSSLRVPRMFWFKLFSHTVKKRIEEEQEQHCR